jgi:hypothetical protein
LADSTKADEEEAGRGGFQGGEVATTGALGDMGAVCCVSVCRLLRSNIC